MIDESLRATKILPHSEALSLLNPRYFVVLPTLADLSSIPLSAETIAAAAAEIDAVIVATIGETDSLANQPILNPVASMATMTVDLRAGFSSFICESIPISIQLPRIHEGIQWKIISLKFTVFPS